MEQKSKIYIAGHKGMVGSALERKLRKEGFNDIITRSSSELDLRNQQAVNDFFGESNIKVNGPCWYTIKL
jgi:GDP-L-fucose synthase